MRFNPEVDRQLDAIVRTALAKEPDDRYEDVDKLSNSLLGYLSSRGLVTTAYDHCAVLGEQES